jgi:hypothetical protein
LVKKRRITIINLRNRCLTAAICRQVSNVSIVLSTRPVDKHLGAGDYALIKNSPTTQLIRVGLLTKAEINQLVCEQLGIDRLPRVIEDVIKDKAQGIQLINVFLKL